MASLMIRQSGAAPLDFYVWVRDDAGNFVDPTGLVAAVGFRVTTWNNITADVITDGWGYPCVHVVILESFRANLSNREFDLHVIVDGVEYGPWVVRLAF